MQGRVVNRDGRQLKVAIGVNRTELLVVAILLGALATFLAFSVSGATTSAAIAQCQANASNVQNALGEFSAETGADAAAITPALLTAAPLHILHSYPSSPDYTISIVGGRVMIAAPPNAAPVPYGTDGACDKAGSE